MNQSNQNTKGNNLVYLIDHCMERVCVVEEHVFLVAYFLFECLLSRKSNRTYTTCQIFFAMIFICKKYPHESLNKFLFNKHKKGFLYLDSVNHAHDMLILGRQQNDALLRQ